MPAQAKHKLNSEAAKLPTTSGVYIMRDGDGTIIYVGKAKNLKSRVSSYFNNSTKNVKTAALVAKAESLEYVLTLSESDALALECNLIKKHMPHYNILLKDGKQFAFVKINLDAEYPKFEVTRKIKKDGAKYFGPYFNGASANDIIEIMHAAFALRTCKTDFSKEKKKKRACLNFDMNGCLAPCVNNCKESYDKAVKNACAFLNGRTAAVEKILKQKMLNFSEAEAFEEALKMRERIKSLARIKEKTFAIGASVLSCDAFAFDGDSFCGSANMTVVREGKIVASKNFAVDNFDKESVSSLLVQIYSPSGINTNKILLPFDAAEFENVSAVLEDKFGVKVKLKKAATAAEKGILKQAQNNASEFLKQTKARAKVGEEGVKALQIALNLTKPPNRMEVYDISNTQGSASVAGMVVFVNGEKDTKSYRKFAIKTVAGADDFASHAEVIERRMKELEWKNDASFSKVPDLIVIDGGKGQLSKIKVSNKINIIAFSENNEIFLSGQSEPLRLPNDNAGQKLLINIRDECHRFAHDFHIKKRSKNMFN